MALPPQHTPHQEHPANTADDVQWGMRGVETPSPETHICSSQIKISSSKFEISSSKIKTS
jgi:hypothetical protein